MTRGKLLTFVLVGSLLGIDIATAEGPVHCGPPGTHNSQSRLASPTPDGSSTPALAAAPAKGTAETLLAGHAIQAAVVGPAVHPEPPDGGNGEHCQLFPGSDAIDWGHSVEVVKLNSSSPGYLEAPLRHIEQGQALELRLALELDQVANIAEVSRQPFIEMDLDRGELQPLLPVRVALQMQPGAAATLRLQRADAKILQSAPALDGAHELRLHWQQLDAQHGEASLLLDGQVLGTSQLHGTPVTLRLGDLYLQADAASHNYIELKAASLLWQR